VGSSRGDDGHALEKSVPAFAYSPLRVSQRGWLS
jgi:hypothetical protein